MKESFSGTSLFLIVVFFIVLFTGYLCLSINQTRAFNVKNAIIRIIERHGVNIPEEGWQDKLSEAFHSDIEEELKNIGYRTSGPCNKKRGVNESEEKQWQGYTVQGLPSSDDNETVFCVLRVKAGNEDLTSPAKTLHYYKVKTFYHFDVPALKLLLKLYIDGDTKAML